jgi:hypothetical protein
MEAATDPGTAAKYKTELAEINALVKELYGDWDAVGGAIDDSGKKLIDQAAKWAAVGRSIIGAAQAVGKMDNATAAALQNALTLGQGVAELFATGGKEGGAEAISGLGGLVAAIGNMGHAASQARQRADELAVSIGRLFTDLANQNSPTKGTSLAERVAAESLSAADRRNQIEKDLGGKANQTEREKALDALNAAEATRIAQITAEYELEQQQAQEDYKVRELNAEGRTVEADALAFAETQQREYQKAVEDGADALTLAALSAAQAAEAYQHAAESALKARQSSTDNDLTLHHVTDPLARFQAKAGDYEAVGGALGDFLKQFDLTSPAGIAQMDAALGDFLDEVKKNPDAFDLAGLSIQDFINALLDLDTSATSVASAIQTAAQKMADAENALSTSDSILGTSPTEQAQERGNLYGFDLGDLSTKGGVDAAITNLQTVFKGLDASAPDYQEKSREILNTIQALRAITFDDTGAASGGSGGLGGTVGGAAAEAAGATSVASQGFQSLTSIQGDELFSELHLHTGLLTDIRDDQRSWMSGRINVGAPTPVNVGGITSAALAAAGSSGGGMVIDVGGIHVTTSKDDAETVGTQVADAFVRELNIKFGRSLLQEKIRNGDITARSA